MKTYCLEIVKGVNDIRLVYGSIKSIEFNTNDSHVVWGLEKYGHFSPEYFVYDNYIHKQYPFEFFMAYRDGLTHLSLDSNCKGFLVIKYNEDYGYNINPIEYALNDFNRKAIDKHYKRQFKIVGDTMLLDKDFCTSFKYYKNDKNEVERTMREFDFFRTVNDLSTEVPITEFSKV